MGNQTRTLETMLLSSQWERAKGELRAFVALQGSYPSGSGNTERWTDLSRAVEDFITDIESKGLQEPANPL